MKPFLKWAGGKRWLTAKHPELFDIPRGGYIEPFLGSGAVFFHIEPGTSVLADQNDALVDLYKSLRANWIEVEERLKQHAERHSKAYYYEVRSCLPGNRYDRAARLLYLNRTCWNGLYRENLKGEFNVPKGTKNTVIFPDDDFKKVGELLQRAKIACSDFEEVISKSSEGDLVFVDPPYTVKHNNNGFVKYNETIFSWSDQVRLASVIQRQSKSGANFIITNAVHSSIYDLYEGFSQFLTVERASVISGVHRGRGRTEEAIILVGPHWRKMKRELRDLFSLQSTVVSEQQKPLARR